MTSPEDSRAFRDSAECEFWRAVFRISYGQNRGRESSAYDADQAVQDYRRRMIKICNQGTSGANDD